MYKPTYALYEYDTVERERFSVSLIPRAGDGSSHSSAERALSPYTVVHPHVCCGALRMTNLRPFCAMNKIPSE